MEEMRLRNRERANSGIESSSLGFFNSYFYSGCDPAFDGISSTGSSCKTGHPQVCLADSGSIMAITAEGRDVAHHSEVGLLPTQRLL